MDGNDKYQVKVPLKCWILSGLPGCGKSRLAKHIADTIPRTCVVSGDGFRNFLMGEGRYYYDIDNPEPVERLVKEGMKGMVRDCLQDMWNVVIDEVNLTENDRLEWVKWCMRWGKRWKRGMDYEENERSLLHYPAVTVLCITEHRFSVLLQRRESDLRGIPREQWIAEIERMYGLYDNPKHGLYTVDGGEYIVLDCPVKDLEKLIAAGI